MTQKIAVKKERRNTRHERRPKYAPNMQNKVNRSTKKLSAYGEGIIDSRCEVGTEYECTGDEGPVVGGVLLK